MDRKRYFTIYLFLKYYLCLLLGRVYGNYEYNNKEYEADDVDFYCDEEDLLYEILEHDTHYYNTPMGESLNYRCIIINPKKLKAYRVYVDADNYRSHVLLKNDSMGLLKGLIHEVKTYSELLCTMVKGYNLEQKERVIGITNKISDLREDIKQAQKTAMKMCFFLKH